MNFEKTMISNIEKTCTNEMRNQRKIIEKCETIIANYNFTGNVSSIKETVIFSQSIINNFKYAIDLVHKETVNFDEIIKILSTVDSLIKITKDKLSLIDFPADKTLDEENDAENDTCSCLRCQIRRDLFGKMSTADRKKMYKKFGLEDLSEEFKATVDNIPKDIMDIIKDLNPNKEVPQETIDKLKELGAEFVDINDPNLPEELKVKIKESGKNPDYLGCKILNVRKEK